MKRPIYIFIIFAGFVFSCNSSDNRTRSTSRLLPEPDIQERLEYEKAIVDESKADFVENSDDSIEGRYKNSEETACELLLDITKTADGYSYKLQVKDRLYEGTVDISVVEGEKYVTLQGIPWEDNGDWDKEGDSDIEMPTHGIDIFWSDEEKMFQNYGNSMNYYVILNCDEKFIRFVKL